MAMKRLSKPVCIIVIVYLVVLLFMLIVPPTFLSNPLRASPAKPTKESQAYLLSYVPFFRADYGALFAHILLLTVVAALALVALSLLSHRRKGQEREE
jgi:NADH:ubiquinone oxidoreductase subunit 3 (subunit A)